MNGRTQPGIADGSRLHPGTQASLLTPQGVAVGDDGTVYISYSGHNRVAAHPSGAPPP